MLSLQDDLGILEREFMDPDVLMFGVPRPRASLQFITSIGADHLHPITSTGKGFRELRPPPSADSFVGRKGVTCQQYVLRSGQRLAKVADVDVVIYRG